MKDYTSKGLLAIIYTVCFVIAFSFFITSINQAYHHEQIIRQLNTEKTMSNLRSDVAQPYIYTMAEVINEIDSNLGVKVFVNGAQISDATLKKCYQNKTYYNTIFNMTANYTKSYEYNADGELIAILYVMV